MITQLLKVLAISFLLITISKATVKDMNQAYASKDYEKTVKYMKPLLESDNTDAMFLAAKMYFRGEGGKQNIEQGLFWLKKAADKNHIESTMTLASLYTQEGSEDWQEACLYYRKAAKLKNAEGMFGAGLCYLTGEGKPNTPEDPIESLAWLILAEKAGASEASSFIKEIKGAIDKRSIQKAEKRAKVLSGDKVSKIDKRPRSIKEVNQKTNNVVKKAQKQEQKISKAPKVNKGDLVVIPDYIKSLLKNSYEIPKNAPNAPCELGVEIPNIKSWPMSENKCYSVDLAMNKLGVSKNSLPSNWTFEETQDREFKKMASKDILTEYTNSSKKKIKTLYHFRKDKLDKVYFLTNDANKGMWFDNPLISKYDKYIKLNYVFFKKSNECFLQDVQMGVFGPSVARNSLGWYKNGVEYAYRFGKPVKIRGSIIQESTNGKLYRKDHGKEVSLNRNSFCQVRSEDNAFGKPSGITKKYSSKTKKMERLIFYYQDDYQVDASYDRDGKIRTIHGWLESSGKRFNISYKNSKVKEWAVSGKDGKRIKHWREKK